MFPLSLKFFITVSILVLRFFPGTVGTDTEDAENDINSIKCVPNLQPETETRPRSSVDRIHLYLNEIRHLSEEFCHQPNNWPYRFFIDLKVSVFDFKSHKEKADLIVFFIPKIENRNAEEEIRKGIDSLCNESYVDGLRYVASGGSKKGSFSVYDKIDPLTVRKQNLDDKQLSKFPWYFNALDVLDRQTELDRTKFDLVHNIERADAIRPLHPFVIGHWTWPYIKCSHIDAQGHIGPPKLLISYTTAFKTPTSTFGLLSFDIDLSKFPINQCGASNEIDRAKDRPMAYFHGTHLCDQQTTVCQFVDEEVGWIRGSYVCQCNKSHYAVNSAWHNKIPGLLVESQWCHQGFAGNESDQSDFEVASCQACATGCPDCEDGDSCMAEVNCVFRMIILCISILCSVGSVGLIGGVFHCRKHKIFSVSSPIFLCICLFGCTIMYTEVIVLFPVLSIETCIAVKWTRHLGFCVTYTALYMKLCRVYLTFRVKSAHKIKLTEKNLLHWMSPIMVIMLLYLFAWTISAPPDYEVMFTHDGKRLHQCVYNWWDHVLSIGEIIFLAYGVFICWRIRENHDAQFISYSIYNIALVNVIMVTLHLLIVPKAGPDMKYLLAFARVQMSTTITIALVLGSKIYRAYRGDYPTSREIANSANGFGGDVLGLEEENQQLKEELQKMAYQMEKVKSYAMTKNNRHISHPSASISDKKDNLTSL